MTLHKPSERLVTKTTRLCWHNISVVGFDEKGWSGSQQVAFLSVSRFSFTRPHHGFYIASTITKLYLLHNDLSAFSRKFRKFVSNEGDSSIRTLFFWNVELRINSFDLVPILSDEIISMQINRQKCGYN